LRIITDFSRKHLTHFPASPLVSLSWFQDFQVGLVERPANGGPRWKPFASSVMLSGSQSRPCVSWAPIAGRGGFICFPTDVARHLLGIDVAAFMTALYPPQISYRRICTHFCMNCRWPPTMTPSSKHWKIIYPKHGFTLSAAIPSGRHCDI